MRGEMEKCKQRAFMGAKKKKSEERPNCKEKERERRE